MENINYKNRGMWLENIIKESNHYYNNNDIALIYKKPTPIKVLNTDSLGKINKAVFNEKSTLDFNGVYKGLYIEFDAKETQNKTSFPLSNIKPHQLEHISKVIKHKGIVFLIIYMCDKFYLLDGIDLISFINNNKRQSIPLSYIKDKAYLIEEKYMPRLDYIKEVDKIIIKRSNL